MFIKFITLYISVLIYLQVSLPGMNQAVLKAPLIYLGKEVTNLPKQMTVYQFLEPVAPKKPRQPTTSYHCLRVYHLCHHLVLSRYTTPSPPLTTLRLLLTLIDPFLLNLLQRTELPPLCQSQYLAINLI